MAVQNIEFPLNDCLGFHLTATQIYLKAMSGFTGPDIIIRATNQTYFTLTVLTFLFLRYQFNYVFIYLMTLHFCQFVGISTVGWKMMKDSYSKKIYLHI